MNANGSNDQDVKYFVAGGLLVSLLLLGAAWLLREEVRMRRLERERLRLQRELGDGGDLYSLQERWDWIQRGERQRSRSRRSLRGGSEVGGVPVSGERPVVVSGQNRLESLEVLEFLTRYRVEEQDGNREKGIRTEVEGNGTEEEDPICAICLSEMSVGGDVVVALPKCMHRFHQSCMLVFMAKGLAHRCPICQEDLVVAFREAYGGAGVSTDGDD
uniref:RING-type domain-containing protein n=1 Tax=Compsopogon caeruleus TaxID=31354 RepID=A0A6T6B406_9RHOD|mmetsp:Transcript_11349/g.22969  ORF Transcript_11349/g.22969 Transcript_11349/m.22969 type:complete len:216 (+) Transcript_11349:173-820(+)|eukprot:CAMPEP_0184685134 /NCGR_PEP_ID=MMETSP0312-20130426/17799_1 /TAXON_ID=31354 /ORGANISM="Compsopogon coeruleus, Strain SAG 36.94" /LENGTH=215 /DNA_ID=CAMNT_0027138931 /DNA_START=152 /DNA_END=799 /DNA_ORIENTATION=-